MNYLLTIVGKGNMFRATIRRLQKPMDLNSYRTISVFTSRQQKSISVTAHDQNIRTSTDVEKNKANLDFFDYQTAFKHRKLSEIVRALIIFKLCTYDTLVRNSLSLMKISKRLLGTRLYNTCMKATIHGQFVAGETEEELKEAVRKLQQNAIGPMLCIPMEEDANQTMSRQSWYNKNSELILSCIRLSKTVDQKYPMSQMKLTAVVPGDLCAALSEMFPDPHFNLNILEQIVNGLNGDTVQLDGLDEDKLTVLNEALKRLKAIGEAVERLEVRLLIDAEYTYMNPALRILSLAMMLQFNKHRPLIAYTYQNYLKKTFRELQKDCKLVRSRGACFATKLVRGAYMLKERKLAKEGGYEDPVHATFEDTTAMYNLSLEYLLDMVKRDPDMFYVIVASHNEGTVRHAIQEIRSRNLREDDGKIFFAQVYGMADYLSSALGNSGFVVYKSMPYGPVDETVAYLHRRALENSSVLGGTGEERKLLWKAFVSRASFGTLPIART